jgi:serine/threonine-protein kinase
MRTTLGGIGDAKGELHDSRASDPLADLPIRRGDLVAGKYRLGGILGVGGMGVVVSALHEDLDQRVALKFLRPAALAKHPDAAMRFAREAQAAARIACEHVVRVLDVGRLPEGVPYLVMEYVEGEDLDHLLERVGRLPLEEAVGFVLQACVALAEAHLAGVVHRDLKPANLLLARRRDGTSIVKVLDFGISKLAGVRLDDRMPTEIGIGTPVYMSPEQMRAEPGVDMRTDVWAIGVVLHELLAGEPPFVGGSVPEICAQILGDRPPPSIAAIRPEIPEEIDLVIARALERDPARRYANVGELARDLAIFAPAEARATLDRILRIFRTSGLWVASLAPGAPAVALQPFELRARSTRIDSSAFGALTTERPPSTEAPASARPSSGDPACRRRRRARIFVAAIVGVSVLVLAAARFARPTHRAAAPTSLVAALPTEIHVAPAVPPTGVVPAPSEIAPAAVEGATSASALPIAATAKRPLPRARPSKTPIVPAAITPVTRPAAPDPVDPYGGRK